MIFRMLTWKAAIFWQRTRFWNRAQVWSHCLTHICISYSCILNGWFLLHQIALYDSCGRAGKVLTPAMSLNYDATKQCREQLLNKTFLGAFHCQTKTLWPPRRETSSHVSVKHFLSVFLDADDISQDVIRMLLFIVMVSSRLHQSTYLVSFTKKKN